MHDESKLQAGDELTGSRGMSTPAPAGILDSP